MTSALAAAQAYRAGAEAVVSARICREGRVDPVLLEREQRAAHGFAWVATTLAALEALVEWGRALADDGRLGDPEQAVIELCFGEYLAQLLGGIPMSANEFVRPGDLGAGALAEALVQDDAVRETLALDAAGLRARLVEQLRRGGSVAEGIGDDTVSAVRDQFRRFTAERITPFAHDWHLTNALIPDALIAQLAELGTFGVCIAPEYGGLGMGKLEMCVVTEELSRGWIGAGSLGTRSEIAGELIGLAGTEAQKTAWLPGIASGAVLPTAVFTEPSHGSDLANLTTRAALADGQWRVDGAKTWITHAARSD
ncbi:MAG: acyl-CoA dehydrogenase, partial [Lysobacteraceae bacterium]